MPGHKIAAATTIADYLIENPMATRQDIADFFGMSYHTVCLVVRNDAFMVLLQERKANVLAAAIGDLPERRAAVTEQALERLGSMLTKSDNPEFILRAASLMLTYGAPAEKDGGGGVNVQINVDRQLLTQARERILNPPAAPPALEAPAPLRSVSRAPGDRKVLEVFD
jgi:hypothetical protein